MRILLADDHSLFREGVARLLAEHGEFTVVATASNGGELMLGLRQHNVDLVVLDLSMPGRSGVELVAHLKSAHAGMKVLVLSMSGDDATVSSALRAGADGYLTKENSADELLVALRQIGRGARYVCADIAERLAFGLSTETGQKKAHECLSEREYRVFEMLVAGKRGAQIATELSLSEKTVSTHKSHVLQKLRLNSSSDLVRYAIRNRLVSA